MPVRPAARHTDALRRPPYWRVPLLPAGSYRRSPCRYIPQPAVPVRPHQPPCRFIPPASAPVRPADRRAGVFRRRQAGLYCRKAALPIPFRSKGYPFHICSAARITVPYSVLRQGTPLGIASRRKGRRLRLLHCGKNRCGLFCLTKNAAAKSAPPAASANAAAPRAPSPSPCPAGTCKTGMSAPTSVLPPYRL